MKFSKFLNQQNGKTQTGGYTNANSEKSFDFSKNSFHSYLVLLSVSGAPKGGLYLVSYNGSVNPIVKLDYETISINNGVITEINTYYVRYVNVIGF